MAQVDAYLVQEVGIPCDAWQLDILRLGMLKVAQRVQAWERVCRAFNVSCWYLQMDFFAMTSSSAPFPSFRLTTTLTVTGGPGIHVPQVRNLVGPDSCFPDSPDMTWCLQPPLRLETRYNWLTRVLIGNSLLRMRPHESILDYRLYRQRAINALYLRINLTPK